MRSLNFSSFLLRVASLESEHEERWLTGNILGFRFNIWNTGHDMNFDRIVHLVKLVFNTRIVVMTLIDGTEM